MARRAAYISIMSRESVMKTTKAKLDREAWAQYKSLYLGNLIRVDLPVAVQGLHDFVQDDMFAWEALPSSQSADGRSVTFTYSLTFNQTFMLGEMGNGVEGISMAMRAKLGMLAHDNQTEAMNVPYRYVFKVEMESMAHGTYVSASLIEQIDPGGSVCYIRNGHVRVPSFMGVRTGSVSQEVLLHRLHQIDVKGRPDLPSWFADEGRYRPDLAKLLVDYQQSEDELTRARTALQNARDTK